MTWKQFILDFYTTTDSYLTFAIGSLDSRDCKVLTLKQDELDVLEEALQQDEQVFFTPANRLQAGKWLTKDDVHSSYYAWVDIDDPKEPVYFGLPPTHVVSSGKGLHVYWKLEEPIEDRLHLEKINKGLAHKIYGADKGAWNSNRWLRVPESNNHKYTHHPEVQLTRRGNSVVYTVEELGLIHHTSKEILDDISRGDAKNYDDDRSLKDFNVIRRLLSTGYSRKTIEKIWTHAPIGKKYREHGNPESYLDITLRNAEYTREDKEEEKGKDVTFGIFEEGNRYYYRSSRSVSQVSNFILHVKHILRDRSGEDVIVADAISDSGFITELILPRKAFNSKFQFAKYNSHVHLSFWGNDHTFEKLLPYIVSNTPTDQFLESTNVVGLHKVGEEYFYVLPEQVISKGGVHSKYDVPISFSISEKEKPEFEIYTETKFNKSKVAGILTLNEKESILSLLGWYSASLIKPYLFEKGYRFPVLSVAGTHGSGKTTLIKLFMQLFGQIPETYTATTTKFVLLSLMGSSNAFPIAISEFRYDHAQTILRYILMSYDKGKDARGTPDQRTIEYPLIAPFSLDGEDFVMDNAAKERLITVSLLKSNAVQTSEFYKSFMNYSVEEGFAPAYMIWLLNNLDKVIPYLKDAYREFEQVFTAPIAERVKHNHCVIHVGNRLFHEFIGLEVPSIDYVAKSMGYVVNVDTGIGRLTIDIFVEDILSFIASHTARFEWEKQDEYVIFQPLAAHRQWLQDRKRAGQPTFEFDAIRQQLKDITYVSAEAHKGGIKFFVNIEQAKERGLNLEFNAIS